MCEFTRESVLDYVRKEIERELNEFYWIEISKYVLLIYLQLKK